MRKKITIAEFSDIIGELAKSVNETFYNVNVELQTSSIDSTMKYTAYINGFAHVSSGTISDCIERMKKQIGIVSPIDHVVCEL